MRGLAAFHGKLDQFAARFRIKTADSHCLDGTPKRAAEAATEMVQVVMPNDANPLGFILGGTVMHLIDIAGAIACHRHTRSLLFTAPADDLQFLNSINV